MDIDDSVRILPRDFDFYDIDLNVRNGAPFYIYI